jgi:hypothetical protein
LLFSVSVQSQTSEINITLTWSTNTYVPLDYPGKALPTKGSVIEVAANVDSREVNPQELNYRWFLNGHLQKGESGKGRSVLGFPVQWTSGNEHSIRIELRDEEENLLASAYLDIGIVQPQVIIQPITSKGTLPLESSVSLIIKEYQISAEQEMSFMAQPYFFNISSINELNFNWSLGDRKPSQISSDNPHVFILKIGQLIQSIKQNLKIGVENKNNPLQRAQMTAGITFIP